MKKINKKMNNRGIIKVTREDDEFTVNLYTIDEGGMRMLTDEEYTPEIYQYLCDAGKLYCLKTEIDLNASLNSAILK